MNEARDLQQHIALLEQKRAALLKVHLSRVGTMLLLVTTLIPHVHLPIYMYVCGMSMHLSCS
jgi:hypothetical protein